MGKNLLLDGAAVFTAPFAKGWLIADAQLEIDFLGKDNCTLDDKKEILATKREFWNNQTSLMETFKMRVEYSDKTATTSKVVEAIVGGK